MSERKDTLERELETLKKDYDSLTREYDSLSEQYDQSRRAGRDLMFKYRDSRDWRNMKVLIAVAIFVFGLVVGKALVEFILLSGGLE